MIDSDTLKRRVQVMRAVPTKAEQAAWTALAVALRRYDVRLIFQEAIGFYIVDFIVYPQRVVVEIDGGIHEKRKEYDARRDSYLRGLGLKVIRFSNETVIADPKGFARAVLAVCKPLRPLPPGREPAWYVPIPLRKHETKYQKKGWERIRPKHGPLKGALSSKATVIAVNP